MRSQALFILFFAFISSLSAAPTQDVFLSLSGSTTLPTVGAVGDEDAVLFDVTAAESGGTTGSYQASPFLDLSIWGSAVEAANVDALHYFLRPMEVPAQSGTTISIPAGSVLVSFDVDSLVLVGTTGLPIGAGDEDVVLFIPDQPGDYTAGQWLRFFDGSDVSLHTVLDSDDVDAVCLVEQDITVGGVDLFAGDILLSFNEIPTIIGARASDVVLFRPTLYGNLTQGSFVTGQALLRGSDEDLNWPGPPNESIEAVHLTGQDFAVGDEIVPAGSFLLSIAETTVTGTIGSPEDLTALDEDVFYFMPTTLGGTLGATSGTFAPLLTGSSTAMGIGSTGVDGLTLLSFPTLSATVSSEDLDGGELLPGDMVRHALQIENSSAAHATGIVVSAELDTDTESLALIDIAGGTDASSPTLLRVEDIVVSPETTITLVWEVQARADLVGGEFITVDGEVASAAEGGTGDIFSDTAGLVVVISFDSGSTLAAEDVNSGDLMPLDTIEYTLTLVNSANQLATGVDVTGTIPTDTHGLTVTDAGGGNASGSTSTDLEILDLQVPALGTTEVRWTAAVDSEAGEAIPIQMDIMVSPPDEGGSALPMTSNQLFTIPAELTVFSSD
ncbi:DUF11 domain-containing protein [Candidatus Sumerlaeota bacterium]|nr:DUF11 domain-containing protein [Candidatus Sumerlaeota bacterium]